LLPIRLKEQKEAKREEEEMKQQLNQNHSIFTNDILRSTSYIPRVTTPEFNNNHGNAEHEVANRLSTQINSRSESRNRPFNKLSYYKTLKDKPFEELTNEIIKLTGQSIKKVPIIKPNKTFERQLLTIHSWRNKENAQISFSSKGTHMPQTADNSSIKKMKKISQLHFSGERKPMSPKIKYIRNMRLRKTRLMGDSMGYDYNSTNSFTVCFKKV
jgi:hypothetical protein